tara:strand:+ start:306 stop:1223 length:918 start_codon:yes stop_codon:yes gene_type:complete
MATPPTKVVKKSAVTPGKQAAPKGAIKAPPFRIETPQKTARHLKLLVYGNYGVGKTTLAATATKVKSMNDVLMVSAEAGDLSLEEFQGLDVVTIQEFKTFAKVHEFLKQHCKARDEGNIEFLRNSEAFMKGVKVSEIKKPKQYNTCIIDTLTEVEAYCFNQLLGITDTTSLAEEVDTAEWGEYKRNTLMIMRVIRAFRDLPMHVIFTCAEKWEQDENKKKFFAPAMTGQLSKKIQGAMDMVGYLVVGREDGKRAWVLYVNPSSAAKYDAKHRYASFKEDSFKNPTIGKILSEVGLLDKKGAPLKT